MFFHKHKYNIVAKTYQEKSRKIPYFKDSESSLFNTLEIKGNDLKLTELVGYTTILWECEKCNKTRKEVLEGKIIK